MPIENLTVLTLPSVTGCFCVKLQLRGRPCSCSSPLCEPNDEVTSISTWTNCPDGFTWPTS